MKEKAIVSSLIFAETMLFCYAPKIVTTLSKYRNEWLNVETINNATSGALLALAITHLLPEGFQSRNEKLTLWGVDMRGFVIISPILLLVTIDFLAGHHCGHHQAAENCNTNAVDDKSQSPTLSDVENSDMKDYYQPKQRRMMKVVFSKVKHLFSSRSLYLLLSFYAHSILEGSLIGCETGSTMWAMAFGILAHKWAECLLLTSTITNLMKSEICENLCIIVFALCVPIGILVGHYAIPSQENTCFVVFSLLAVGFFIYLAFELFTANTGQKARSRIILWIFFVSGAVLMSLILFLSSVLEG
ncbi:zinc transport protein, putative [Theileria equi strain WA]|uniref:Zinc transport protein, putative n=1 Tax=Theileria equi strain WA TaxID=1537102 RepID=L1LBB9_THEEQ|nr:zinc transport protein, putative [Theileria equi strain WA]EKX72626.1 zinc transport protein, putative [Theileria equi strain WA]|eukprot:XP_004832078.1 zinc transport protein, putative [Theileria equi strain WA]